MSNNLFICLFLLANGLACTAFFVLGYATAEHAAQKDLDDAQAHIKRQNKEIDRLKEENFKAVTELVAFMIASDINETDK